MACCVCLNKYWSLGLKDPLEIFWRHRFLDHLPRDCNYVGLAWVLRVFFLSKLTGDADFAGSWKYIFTSKALEWVLMKWRKRVNKKLFHPALGGEAMAELWVILQKHRRGNKQLHLAQVTRRSVWSGPQRMKSFSGRKESSYSRR